MVLAASSPCGRLICEAGQLTFLLFGDDLFIYLNFPDLFQGFNSLQLNYHDLISDTIKALEKQYKL